MHKKLILPKHLRDQFPDNEEKGGEGEGKRNEVRVDVTDLPEHMEVVVRNTGNQVHRAAGTEIENAQSFGEAKRAVETTEAPKENVENREEVPEVEAPEIEEETPKVEPTTKSSNEEKSKTPKQQKGPNMKDKLKKLYENDKMAARAAGGVAVASALPAFVAASGIPLATAGVSALALTLPYLAYKGSSRKGRKAGAVVGAVGSAGLLATGAVSLSSLAAVGSAVAIPAAVAYGGYRIGKNMKRPVAGALVGAGAGMLAAPAVSGAVAGVMGGAGWTAVGGAAAGIGAGAAIPLAAAAGTYGVIKGVKWIARKWKSIGKKS